MILIQARNLSFISAQALQWEPSSSTLSRSSKGKENEELSLSQDGKRPVNEGRDEQSDSGFAMNGHGDPDPAQP